jgi:hypothetical protein
VSAFAEPILDRDILLINISELAEVRHKDGRRRCASKRQIGYQGNLSRRPVWAESGVVADHNAASTSSAAAAIPLELALMSALLPVDERFSPEI